jgi:hypothetical protein
MKNRIATVKKFAQDHKTALTVAATATPFVLLMMRNAKYLNEFLDERGLSDEYYFGE